MNKSVNIPITTEFYTLNRWLVWCINYISIMLRKKKKKKKAYKVWEGEITVTTKEGKHNNLLVIFQENCSSSKGVEKYWDMTNSWALNKNWGMMSDTGYLSVLPHCNLQNKYTTLAILELSLLWNKCTFILLVEGSHYNHLDITDRTNYLIK